MKKLIAIHNNFVKPFIALISALFFVLFSIELYSQLLEYTSVQENSWIGYLWAIFTFYWMIVISVWGLKGIVKETINAKQQRKH